MATRDISVNRAFSFQQDLKWRPEHCSADPETLAAIVCTRGHQLRVLRNDGEYALYTVSEVRQESPQDIVRMGLAGRRRLGTEDRFDAVLDSQVTHPTLSEGDARNANEFIERLDDDGRHGGLIVIAPHGGAIEPHTDDQAEHVASRLASKGVSSWRCKGWGSPRGAFERWHITSTDINPESFPRLNTVIGRGFAYAVAFHGFEESAILVGGCAEETLKCEVAAAIDGVLTGSGIQVRIAQPSDGLGGDDPRNIVNRLTGNGRSGLQIEQPFEARSNHWLDIADAVADVFAPKLDTEDGTPVLQP